MSDKKAGIFSGLEGTVNRYLLDPTWRRKNGKNTSFSHKKNCLLLSGNSTPSFFKARKMISEMLGQIESNISNHISATVEKEKKRTPSKANWNLNCRDKSNPKVGMKNKSPEVTLERAIIQARRMPHSEFADKWTYQMPVATGLFGSDTNKSSNIDLVRRRSDGVFDLIELKIGSDNPLYAAVELLQYGLAYAASRQFAQQIGYDTGALEILKATQINLCVLAPKSFYEPPKTDEYNFGWLEQGLNNALKHFNKKKHGYHMTFKFCLLNLNWKPEARPNSKTLDNINKAIDNISPVPWVSSVEK